MQLSACIEWQFEEAGEGLPERIRAAADANPRTEPTLKVQVTDAQGEVIAEVERTLHVRRKDAPRAPRRAEGAA